MPKHQQRPSDLFKSLCNGTEEQQQRSYQQEMREEQQQQQDIMLFVNLVRKPLGGTAL